MGKRRNEYGQIAVQVDTYVDVDLDEVMHDVEDDIIRKECTRRGIELAPCANDPEALRELGEAIRRAADRRDMLDLDVQLRALLDAAGVPRLRILSRRATEMRAS